jgi:uroporphyrinogen-III synthase
MQPDKINILCTRPLNVSLLNDAKRKGIYIDTISFIETEAVQSVEIQQEVEQVLLQSATVVFTSMNAVEAVAFQLEGHQPDWSVYCMGNTTQQLVEKYFGKESIAGTAADAAMLAENIVDDGAANDVYFFCGNQRRTELPDILKQHDINVNEIVVYNTVATPHKVSKPYNGILFFSPSAVDSFFSVNKAEKQTILFAIGNTTAAAIKKYATNSVITSDEPGKESLVEKMIDFFAGI